MKRFFTWWEMDWTGKVVIRKRCSRRQLLAFTERLRTAYRRTPDSAENA